VAPEHVSDETLDKMKKPGIESYDRFTEPSSARRRLRARISI
jgi:hypothetical protein